MSGRVELVADQGNRCGEGPIWDAAGRRLLWTDIPADVVYEYVPASGAMRVLCRGVSVSTIALGQSGELLFGGADGLGVWSQGAGWRPLVREFEGEKLMINDMIAAPWGGIYFGTAYWGAAGMEKPGRLFLWDARAGLRVVDTGVELANGLGWSPDGRTLYFVDSAARRVYAYDVDVSSGALSAKRVFAQFSREEGLPDGMTVDAQGRVWCAMWYGGCVVRLGEKGLVERRIEIPAIQVSSVAFGGEGLDELYVTTAGEAWPSELAPSAYRADAAGQGGGLYRIRPGVSGTLEYVSK